MTKIVGITAPSPPPRNPVVISPSPLIPAALARLPHVMMSFFSSRCLYAPNPSSQVPPIGGQGTGGDAVETANEAMPSQEIDRWDYDI
mmetsp:Transcript_25337/g.46009  ORF Transcript_25337/g.46009 Transcript_25337/m.46009 type:complete len:88 (+) Transcript_25337:265-528(+)